MVSDADVARFVSRFTIFCELLVSWCKDCGVKEFLAHEADQPICASAFFILIHADPDALARSLLSFIPEEVKSLLGKESLTIEDIFTAALPRVELCRDGGCYLYIALKEADSGSIQWTTAEVYGQDFEAGVYAGSSMDSRAGVATRVAAHEYFARKREKGLNLLRDAMLSEHYRFTGRSGVQSQFFLIAQIPYTCTLGKSASLLIEAVIQAYLNLVQQTSISRP